MKRPTPRTRPLSAALPRLLAATAVALAAAAGAGTALAHTSANVVAVPAGEEATVVLQPGHGCSGSPTVQVRIRAPFPDAVAVRVEGWTESSSPDGEGNSVLEWTGGSLPADQEGSFPVEFVAGGEPGTLLLFPAVQRCANGEELAWIDGDPRAEHPAPRVLVLPAGYEPAATIDDVPADAPGRELLTQVVDVDSGTGTTVPATPEPGTSGPPGGEPAGTDAPGTTVTLGAPATTTTEVAASAPEPAAEEKGNGAPIGVIVLIVVVAAIAAGAAVLYVRNRPSR